MNKVNIDKNQSPTDHPAQPQPTRSAALSALLHGFGERYSSLLRYAPLLRLADKQRFAEYHLPELGFAILLRILDSMVRWTNDATYDSLTQFVTDLALDQWGTHLENETARDLTSFVVDELRNRGSRFRLPFRDFATRAESASIFSLVETAEASIADRTVRLRLTNEGLDLMFRTREIYEELGISINQLYLRQQIVKGVFDGALQTVADLRVQVQALGQRIDRLCQTIRRDPARVVRENNYQRILERINDQLETERTVFRELQRLLDESRRTHDTGTERSRTPVERILTLKRDLNRVVNDHEGLFLRKLRMSDLLASSFDSALITAFQTRVQLEREVLQPLIASQGSPAFLAPAMAPFMPMRHRHFFNPMQIFAEQVARNRRSSADEARTLLEADETYQRIIEQREAALSAAQEAFLRDALAAILTPLTLGTPSIRVGELLALLENQNPHLHTRLTNRVDFYGMLVQLHQIGKITLTTWDEQPALYHEPLPRALLQLATDNPNIRALDAFEVCHTSDVLRLANGVVMSDFIVSRQPHSPGDQP